MNREIIIIGAGAAGLIAARELSRAGYKVQVLEARRRIGGRIHTMKDKKFTSYTETGAEFIHGKLETTFSLLKEYKIKTLPAKGQVWQLRFGESDKDKELVPVHHRLLSKKLNAVKRDLPLSKFIHTHFHGKQFSVLRAAVQGFVEGYESADLEHFSTIAFREEWHSAEDWKQFRVENGYGTLVEAIAEDARSHGCIIRLANVVQSISWKPYQVEVHCANDKMYTAQQALITVPLGILQSNKVKFTPALPEKMQAVKALGYGHVIKILMLFTSSFWKQKAVQERVDEDLNKLFFLFSQEEVPTWWTQYPSSVGLLTGWVAGPKAKRWSSLTDKVIRDRALKSIASIFKMDVKTVRSKLKSWKVVNWTKDEWTLGAYTYNTVNAEKYRSKAGKPEKQTLFFAGEHFAEEPGTVEAALKSGLKVAREIMGK